MLVKAGGLLCLYIYSLSQFQLLYLSKNHHCSKTAKALLKDKVLATGTECQAGIHALRLSALQSPAPPPAPGPPQPLRSCYLRAAPASRVLSEPMISGLPFTPPTT